MPATGSGLCLVIARHLQALRADGYSESTITLAEAWLLRLQEFAANRDLTELRPQDLEQWQKQLRWTPGPRGALYSDNTINQAVGTARRFYRYLQEAGEVGENPAAGLTLPKVQAAKREFSLSEVRRVLASPPRDTPNGIRDRAVLGVILETRMPTTACSRLDLTDVCFDTAALRSQGRIQAIHAVSDGLLADLERYLRESRPLLISPEHKTDAFFLNVRGHRLSTQAVRAILRRYVPRS